MKDKRIFRVGIAQMNPCVGDFKGNSQAIASYIDQAKSRNCHIVCFPELAVCGYPPEDLLFKKSFVQDSIYNLGQISKRTEGIIAVVGFLDRWKDNLYNSAAVLTCGKVIDIYRKMHLPNYGVFDEKRYFSNGNKFSLYEACGARFGINICEDIWAQDGVLSAQGKSGAQLIITINASPYHMGKVSLREKILSEQAKANNVFIIYANLVGGQDELVFDGQSMVISNKGKVLSRAKAFEEELSVFDIDLKKVRQKKKARNVKVFSIDGLKKDGLKLINLGKVAKINPKEEVFKALVLGTRDYCIKNGFNKVILGLSGGIDSSLVAVIAKEALGRENVCGYVLPSKFNSKASYEDAIALAKNLKIECKVIPIQEIFEDYLRSLDHQFLGRPWNVAEENIQARIRGNILMAISNKFGWLVLTTGNKSEMSVGYATLYGDMAGGFAVIKDVPKTLVYKLAEFYNTECGEIIPERVLEKAPSAELKERQKDTDSLPPYDVLDDILRYYIEEDMSASEIIKKGFNPNVVFKTIQMVDKSEYKRRQSPPGVKITPRAFGKDRRMPITNKFKEY